MTLPANDIYGKKEQNTNDIYGKKEQNKTKLEMNV